MAEEQIDITKLTDKELKAYFKSNNHYDVGNRQANNLVDVVNYMKSKGYDHDQIMQLITEKDWLNPSVSGKSVKLSEVDSWILNKNNTNNLQQDFYNMMSGYQQDLKNNLMLDASGPQAQQYKQDMYSAINQYESDLEASLASAEMSAYAQLGQQQLELENTIADQRMKALKSGTTSAQLASQQLSNMFAAQSGAAQVANSMMSNRLQNYNTISQARYGVTQDMYNTINANRQAYATAQPQLAAVAGSYAANANLPYLQFDAYNSLTDKQKKDYKQ